MDFDQMTKDLGCLLSLMVLPVKFLGWCIEHWKFTTGFLALVYIGHVGAGFASPWITAIPASAHVSAQGKADIPPAALADYVAAAATCPGLSWAVLAGIGKEESDHGRSNLPGVHSGSNSAGAEGPMQFLPATWAQYGAGGDIYDHRDASFGAARLLCANGGGNPSRLDSAIWDYNHDWGYVASVKSIAASYVAA